MLIDTHCHIHDEEYPLDRREVIEDAIKNNVQKMICIGTSDKDSKMALELAAKYPGIVYAAVGVHPHDGKDGCSDLEKIISEADSDAKPIAIGEIGLDYHYDYSPKEDQIRILNAQIEFAIKHDLPVIFHVRDAFDDFWPIFDNFSSIRGVIHSFTDNPKNLKAALDRGLYIGVNGYSTFCKDDQRAMFDDIPLDRMLLETDAPYLTPVPFRGKINKPAYIAVIAGYHANMRGLSVDEIANSTTKNARDLFAI